MAEETSFKLTYLLYASPEKVFDAITTPAMIEKWSGGKATLEPVEGGAFEMFDGWVKGEIISYKPSSLLSYTWKPAEWNAAIKPSVVELMLRKDPAGTALRISHSGLPGKDEAGKHKEGWINFVLEPLNDFLIT